MPLSRPARTRFRVRPTVESLEPRDVPAAATATLNAGTLSLNAGGDGGHTFLFRQNSDNGQDLLWIEGLAVSVEGVKKSTVFASTVTSIVVTSVGPNDTVDLSGGTLGTAPVKVPATISGGSGASRLIGGAGNDTITGGGGPTVIDGGGGTNTLRGGSGNATFITRSAGDTIINGTGANTTRTVLAGYRSVTGVVDVDGTHEARVYIPSGVDPDKKYPVVFDFSPLGANTAQLERSAERQKFVVVGFQTGFKQGVSLSASAGYVESDITTLGKALTFADTSKVLLSGLSAGAKFVNFLNVFPDLIGLSRSPGWAAGTLEQSDSLQSVLNDNGWNATDLPTTMPAGKIAMIVWPADNTNNHPIGDEVKSDRDVLYPKLGFDIDYQEYGGIHSTRPTVAYDRAMQWLLGAKPLVAGRAAASAATVTGKSVDLSVVADDAAGDGATDFTSNAPNLTYTWAVRSGPTGVTFSANGTNAAKATTATFAAAGTYTFRVTVTNAAGDSSTSDVTVTVARTLTSLALSPATVSVPTGGSQTFIPTGKDQFGAAMSALPTLTWSVPTGVGSVTSSGVYSAGTTAGTASVRAANGSVSAMAGVTVFVPANPPTVTSPASASVNPVTGRTVTVSVLGASSVTGGESALTYTWDVTAAPTGVLTTAFSFPAGIANGSNGAKAATVTFTAAGTYELRVTIADPTGAATTSTTRLTVSATPSAIRIDSPPTRVGANGVVPFAATVRDQFDRAIPGAVVTWSATGAGVVSPAGVFTSGPVAGDAEVVASFGSVTGRVPVRVFDDASGFGPSHVDKPARVVTAGGSTGVRVYNPDKTERFAFDPFPGFTGGVRVATADVTGDGVPDTIAGSGPGSAPTVVVFDGATRTEIARFNAFEATFTGGVYVAAGDLDGDGRAELVVTPDQGGGPVVAVFRIAGAITEVTRFFGIDDGGFRGGARAAVGDVTGDGVPDLVVAAGFLGGPRVTVWDGASVISGRKPTAVANFFAFEDTLRNGCFVAVGDVTGDGISDLVFGGGPGGSPRVRVADGAKLIVADGLGSLDDQAAESLTVGNFMAGDPDSRGGVRVSLADLDSDGLADVVTGGGDGSAAVVVVYPGRGVISSAKPAPIFDVLAFDSFNGVFVG